MFKISNQTIPPKVLNLLMSNPVLIAGLSIRQLDGTQLHQFHKEVITLHSEKCLELVKRCASSQSLPMFNFFGLMRTYMYTGNLEIPRTDLLAFNEAITRIRLDTLMQDIATNITFESVNEVIQFLQQAIKFENLYMCLMSFDKFVQMFDSVSIDEISELITDLSLDLMEKILQAESVHKNGDSEVKLALIVGKWLSTHSSATETKLKSYVKFDQIKFSDLVSQIRPLGLLTDSEYIGLLEKSGLAELKTPYEKFFVCNAHHPIPDGFRAITDEEFHTDKFKKSFMGQPGPSFESIKPNSHVFYLLTASQKTIRIRKSNNQSGQGHPIKIKQISSSDSIKYVLDESSTDGDEIFLVKDYTMHSRDGYLCVKV